MKKHVLLLIPLLFLTRPVQAETTIPDRPENGIYDPNNRISANTIEKIKQFDTKNDVQFDVCLIENSEDYWILEEANQVAEKWNLNQNLDNKKVVLVTIDTKNRNAWIETSTEVQKYISNRDAMNILSDVEKQLIGEKYDTAVSYILEQTNIELTKGEDMTSIESTKDPEPKDASSIQNHVETIMISGMILQILMTIGIPVFVIIFYIRLIKKRIAEKVETSPIEEKMDSAIFQEKDQKDEWGNWG
jgi:hypothetical protein